MAVLTTYLKSIANAYRSKLGTTESIPASDFPKKVSDVYDAGCQKTTRAFWDGFQRWNGTKCQRKAYNQAFMNWGHSSICPEFDVEDAKTDVKYMFYACTYLKKIDFSGWTWASASGNAERMFQNCSEITTIDWATNFKFKPSDLSSTFNNCTSLVTLKDLPVDSVKTITSYAFYQCSKLKNLTVTGEILISGFNFKYCKVLTAASLLSILTALSKDSAVATGKTLTLNSANKTVINADADCLEQYNSAIAAGWTIAFA